MGTLVSMVDTGILPACTKDLANFSAMPSLAGERQTTYQGIKTETEKLKDVFQKRPHTGLLAEATYICDVVKPQMSEVRRLVDEAEGLMEKSLYPYPTYEALIYS